MAGRCPARAREVQGARASHAQHSVFVVSMGRYTADARRVAAQVGTAFVDGDELLRIMSAGLVGQALELPVPGHGATSAWPAYGAEMARPAAGQGLYAGRDFLGCSAFRACRTTAPIPEEARVAL
jgi:restriction system protein